MNKIEKHWEKLINKERMIALFRLIKLVGFLIGLASFCFFYFNKKNASLKEVKDYILFFFASFAISMWGDLINDIILKPEKERLSVENIIKIQKNEKVKKAAGGRWKNAKNS